MVIAAALVAAATSMRAPFIVSHNTPRSRPPVQTLDDALSPWRDEEDWALVEAMPEFTVSKGNAAATFWTALAASSAVLCQRSPAQPLAAAPTRAAAPSGGQRRWCSVGMSCPTLCVAGCAARRHRAN